MTRTVEVRSGAYQDSVTLMQLSRRVQDRDDVAAALVAMATPLNLDLLTSMGFEPPAAASPNDLLVAVETVGPPDSALAAVDELLTSRTSAAPGTTAGAVEVPPLTTASAARRAPVGLVLVSTPGPVATMDAVDALDAGRDVMIFSDNVSVADEVALKDRATRAGLLVMGPDCGTAVVAGLGLGFANVVRPGPVGLVAASGTGAQQVMALLSDTGVGIAACLGVGGRDLSAEVAARSTLAALARLDADPEVAVIGLVSKPPDPAVAARVEAYADGLATPVLTGFVGPARPDLTDLAERLTVAAGRSWAPPTRRGPQPRPRPGALRGLFSGGTLCDEAMVIAVAGLGAVESNIPLPGQRRITAADEPAGHAFLDFGDDAFTTGRPHPMIDGSLRLARLERELADPACAAALLDVVLGHGADPDPASDLVALVGRSDTPVLVSLVGTADDPQGRDEVADRLVAAGAVVHASNAQAAREAVGLARAVRDGS